MLYRQVRGVRRNGVRALEHLLLLAQEHVEAGIQRQPLVVYLVFALSIAALIASSIRALTLLFKG